MKERTTQVLLAVACALLVAHYFRSHSRSTAHAAESEDIPAVIRARMIELVDDQGQIRANLKIEPSGEAVFRLRDSKGAIRVKLGASDDGSGLLLMDDRTEPAVQVLATENGTSLALSQKNKEQRVFKP